MNADDDLILTKDEMLDGLERALEPYHLTAQEWLDQLDDCGCCMKDGYDNAPSHLWIFSDLIEALAERQAQSG